MLTRNLPTLVHTYFIFAKFFFGPNTTTGLVHDFFQKPNIRTRLVWKKKKNTNTKTSLACSNVNTKQYEMKKMPSLFKQNFFHIFDNKFGVLPTHGKNLNFFLMSSLTCNQIQLKYLVEGHQPTYLTKMKKKSSVLTPFLWRMEKKKEKNKEMLPRFVIYLQQHVHVQKEKKKREFWKNQLPNLTLNSTYQNVLHLGHKAITHLQGPFSVGLLWL